MRFPTFVPMIDDPDVMCFADVALFFFLAVLDALEVHHLVLFAKPSHPIP